MEATSSGHLPLLSGEQNRVEVETVSRWRFYALLNGRIPRRLCEISQLFASHQVVLLQAFYHRLQERQPQPKTSRLVKVGCLLTLFGHLKLSPNHRGVKPNRSKGRAGPARGFPGRFRQPVKSGSSRGSKPRTTGGGKGGGNKQAPTPKTGPKKAPAAKSNKPEPKKTNTGHSTNVKSGTPSEPPVLVKDFPPSTPVQAQVSCWGGAVSGLSSSPSPIETALQQQIGELRRQNRILARRIQELEAKQVGSPEPVQEA
ncbi:hypothetical protein MRX96_021362 [Rhipicephalus microplus]